MHLMHQFYKVFDNSLMNAFDSLIKNQDVIELVELRGSNR